METCKENLLLLRNADRNNEQWPPIERRTEIRITIKDILDEITSYLQIECKLKCKAMENPALALIIDSVLLNLKKMYVAKLELFLDLLYSLIPKRMSK